MWIFNLKTPKSKFTEIVCNTIHVEMTIPNFTVESDILTTWIIKFVFKVKYLNWYWYLNVNTKYLVVSDVLSLCYQSTVCHFIHLLEQMRITSFWSAGDSTLSSLKLTDTKEVKRPNSITLSILCLVCIHTSLDVSFPDCECFDSKFNSLIKILCISLFLMDYTELLSHNLSVQTLITTEYLIINYYRVMHQ